VVRKKHLKIIVLLITIIFLSAYLLPAIFISNGTERYSGVDKEYAESSIRELDIALSTPSFYKLVTTKLKVTDFKQVSDENCKYIAIIQGYTYFGIHTENAKWKVSECGVMPYKLSQSYSKTED